MEEYYGADIGRGNTKLVCGPGENDRLIFSSFVAAGKEVDLSPSNSSLIDNLIVTINGKEWFMGELARLHGGTREFSKDKYQHQNTLPLMLCAMAISSKESNLVPKIVTGLPISNYRNQSKAIESLLPGEYNVKLPGKEVDILIDKNNVLVLAEGAAIGWNLALDWNGKISNMDLFKKTIAIIEIGWKTINICVFRNMKYDDSQSTTMPLGMSKAFTKFYKRIIRSKDLTPGKAEALLSKEGSPEFKELTQEIIDSVSMYWPDLEEFDEMYIAGGGGMTLKKYLPWPLIPVPDSIFANANGNYKIARRQL